MDEFMRATYMTALSAGLDIVPLDTAARVMAILCVWGNNENFVYSPKFNAEREYIQKRYHLEGGESPDIEFANTLRFYIKELEDYRDYHPVDWANGGHSTDCAPKWANDILMKRYGFKLMC